MKHIEEEGLEERWLPIPNFPEYEVSSLGRIKRVTDSRMNRFRAGHILTPGRNRAQGYLGVTLRLNGTKHYRGVHRLVAMAFLGPCPDGCQVNHKDGNKDNNTVENLEYTTPSQNVKHAVRLGLKPIGENHPKARLTRAQVRRIKQLLAEGKLQADIAHEFGVHESTIGAIKHGKNWRHVQA